MDYLNDFIENIKKVIPPDRLLKDEPMKLHTTFRVGGPADWFVRAKTEEMPGLMAAVKESHIPYTVIGRGSNLLVRDGGIRGLVIEFGANAAGIELREENGQKIIVAEAGASLSAVAQAAAEHALSGFAFASGIPGSVGGAVAMNAGAYGGEMKDVVCAATVLEQDGTVRRLLREELDFSYRHSVILDRGCLVLSAEFLLPSGVASEIRAEMSEYARRRLEKQPLEYASAGSTFKRPAGYFAGKLIEDAGLRGYRVGDAQVSEKHCGFVINRGGATAAELLTLIEDVKKKVFEHSGVLLEPEVRILGE